MTCGSEPTVFKQYFSTWSEPDEVILGAKKQVLVDIMSEAEQNDADLENIHASKEARSAKLMTRYVKRILKREKKVRLVCLVRGHQISNLCHQQTQLFFNLVFIWLS